MATHDININRLQKEFFFYQKSRNYFDTILKTNEYNYASAYSAVIKNIADDWQSLNLDWLVIYLKTDKSIKQLLKSLLTKFTKYGIGVDI